MIDAIHRRFGAIEPTAAWARLTDPDNPAISFHVLPIDEIGADDDLYVKTNSRGKPLTPFETSRRALSNHWPDQTDQREFARKIDKVLSDALPAASWR